MKKAGPKTRLSHDIVDSAELGALARSRLLAAAHVGGLQTLGALHHLELDDLTLVQAAKALGHDRRVVNEHVRPTLTGDEPEPLGVVEPLHRALFGLLFHSIPSLFPGGGR